MVFHLPSLLSFQNPNPRYLNSPSLMTFVFVVLTFNPSFLSIQSVLVCITLFAAVLLPAVITWPSKYITNWNHLLPFSYPVHSAYCLTIKAICFFLHNPFLHLFILSIYHYSRYRLFSLKSIVCPAEHC